VKRAGCANLAVFAHADRTGQRIDSCAPAHINGLPIYVARVPVAPSKLVRFPTRSSLTLATLPSTSLVPIAPFTFSLKAERALIRVIETRSLPTLVRRYPARFCLLSRCSHNSARSSRNRSQAQKSAANTDSSETVPPCPVCNALMVKRLARRGVSAGSNFWGCSNYPKCRGTRAG
jgi:hypothetical protein